jgi:hypothetical protein
MPACLSAFYALLIVSLSCTPALAAKPGKEMPDTIDLKMGDKALRFEHKKHSKSVDNICIYCHLTESGKIDGGLGKDTARILCFPCHDRDPNFINDCKECHNSITVNTVNKN